MKILKIYLKAVTLVCLIAVMIGCSGSQTTVQVMDSPGNNPFYLCRNAGKYLEQNEITQAEELYKKALGIEKDYPLALVGLGKINSFSGNIDQAIEYCEKAINKSKNKEHKLLASTELMKIYYKARPESWFTSQKKIWKRVEAEYDNPEAAALIMGKSYLAENQYLKATVYFRQVIEWDGESAAQADNLLNGVYQQLRAEPGTHAGKKIAKQAAVTRADLCVLLVEELKIIDYLKVNSQKKYGSKFKTPEEFNKSRQEINLPSDISGHPYENDIKLILAYEFEGLTAFTDEMFRPEDRVSRAGFSMIVEDILARIKNDTLLKQAFVGNDSPFPDVSQDHYALNAIIVCTTRNFLAADLDGAFRPDEPATGTETLLAVRRLKEEIKKHQVKY